MLGPLTRRRRDSEQPIATNINEHRNRKKSETGSLLDWQQVVFRGIRACDWEYVRECLQQLSDEVQQLRWQQRQQNSLSSIQELLPATPSNNKKKKRSRFWKRAVGVRGSGSGKLSATEPLNYSDEFFTSTLQETDEAAPTTTTKSFSSEDFSLSNGSLLQVDADGRTPLHSFLAFKKTPVDIILSLIDCGGKEVCQFQDDRQRLPIHYAVLNQYGIEVIAQIVEMYPAGLVSLDCKGHSPLSYAVEIAKKQTDLRKAHKCYWMPAQFDTFAVVLEKQSDCLYIESNPSSSENCDVTSAAGHVNGVQVTIDDFNYTSFNSSICHGSVTSFLYNPERKEVVKQNVVNIFSPNSSDKRRKVHFQEEIHVSPVQKKCELVQWQREQSKRWRVVHWLLLSLATHSQTSLSIIQDKEKPMLVDCLLYAAPPSVISLLIGASIKLLSFQNHATAFAGSTLYSCISRHYPLSILHSLCSQCPLDVRKVRDETGMGLVAAHFLSGCFEQQSNDHTGGQEWTVSWPIFSQLQRAIQQRELPHRVDYDNDEKKDGNYSDNNPRYTAFVDWWQKMEYLIAFCAGEQMKQTHEQEQVENMSFGVPIIFENDYRRHLLHMALRNPDVPPPVISLLLALYPDSLMVFDTTPTMLNSTQSTVHWRNQLPIHLVASSGDYIPRNYEFQIPGNELTSAELVVQAYVSALPSACSLWYRHDKRLPLHLALDAGKMSQSLAPFYEADLKVLEQRDPYTGLFPFQLAASYNALISNSTQNGFRWNCVARNKYSHAVWKGLSEKLKAKAILRVAHVEDIDRLTTIYVLLRRRPSVLHPVSEMLFTSSSRDETGMGQVAAHFWNMLLERKENGYSSDTSVDSTIIYNDCTKIDLSKKDEFEVVLKKAKKSTSLSHASPDFVNWWTKLKFLLRHCLPSHLTTVSTRNLKTSTSTSAVMISAFPDAIPVDDDRFLLHAALANSDTPPQVVELILALFPSSLHLSIPGTSSWLPLHICAATIPYTPRQFELGLLKLTNQKLFQQSMSTVLQAYPLAARVPCDRGLPLHVAILSGKTWTMGIQALVEHEPRALRVRDAQTLLMPFQLMAFSMRRRHSPEYFAWFQHVLRNKFSKKEYRELTPIHMLKEIRRIQKEFWLESLSTVFELLRREPSAMSLLTTGRFEVADDISMGENELVQCDKHKMFLSNSHSLLFQQSVSLLERSAASFNNEPESPAALPKDSTALMRLLTQQSGKTRHDNEVFICDASILSGVDVMETINTRACSPSFQGNQNATFYGCSGASISNTRRYGQKKSPLLLQHLNDTKKSDDLIDEEEISLSISELIRMQDSSLVEHKCLKSDLIDPCTQRLSSASRVSGLRPLPSDIQAKSCAGVHNDNNFVDSTQISESSQNDTKSNQLLYSGYESESSHSTNSNNKCSLIPKTTNGDTKACNDSEDDSSTNMQDDMSLSMHDSDDESFFEDSFSGRPETRDSDSEDESEISEESFVFFQMKRRKPSATQMNELLTSVTSVRLEKRHEKKQAPTRTRSMPVDRRDSLSAMLIERPGRRRDKDSNLSLNLNSNHSSYSSVTPSEFYKIKSTHAGMSTHKNSVFREETSCFHASLSSLRKPVSKTIRRPSSLGIDNFSMAALRDSASHSDVLTSTLALESYSSDGFHKSSNQICATKKQDTSSVMASQNPILDDLPKMKTFENNHSSNTITENKKSCYSQSKYQASFCACEKYESMLGQTFHSTTSADSASEAMLSSILAPSGETVSCKLSQGFRDDHKAVLTQTSLLSTPEDIMSVGSFAEEALQEDTTHTSVFLSDSASSFNEMDYNPLSARTGTASPSINEEDTFSSYDAYDESFIHKSAALSIGRVEGWRSTIEEKVYSQIVDDDEKVTVFDKKAMRWVRSKIGPSSRAHCCPLQQSTTELASISEHIHYDIPAPPNNGILERSQSVPVSPMFDTKFTQKSQEPINGKIHFDIQWPGSVPAAVKHRRIVCPICDSHRCDVLLVPCRHLAICRECSAQKNISSCPLCHAVVKDRMLIF